MDEVTALVVGYRARVVAATLAAQYEPAAAPTMALVTELRPTVEQRSGAEQRSPVEQRHAPRTLTSVPEVH